MYIMALWERCPEPQSLQSITHLPSFCMGLCFCSCGFNSNLVPPPPWSPCDIVDIASPPCRTTITTTITISE